MKDVKNGWYRFDNVEIDVQNLRVTVASDIRPLEPKSFRLLLFLVENPGRVLPKDEIISAVWPDIAVSDNSLTRAITQVRKALNDDPKAPRYIETVPTVGYRFIRDCKGEQNPTGASDATDEGHTKVIASVSEVLPSPVLSQRWTAIVGAAAVVVGLAVGGWLILRSRNSERIAPGNLKWEQITFFTDSAVSPALSPDGRILTFIRAKGTFVSRGQIYAKSPSGLPRKKALRSTQMENRC